MKSWPEPSLPSLPGRGGPVRLHDTVAGEVVDVPVDGPAGLYVCGITPYDAAHLGHASTYVAFDLLHRAWLDAGHEVRYVQNVTDVDDPLLERATATGVRWQDLAEQQTDVFRDDMGALAVIPPHAFVGVTEVVPQVGELVLRLEAAGAAYRLDADSGDGATTSDVYFDVASVDDLGGVSGLDRATMLHLAAERGGDPDRPGKRDALDPLLWRGRRAGEPSWPVDGLPDGRPGWHVECVAIALEELGHGFAVQGGGSDLVFPHHEMGAAHSHALGLRPYARTYVHTGMVALDGVKMSKSLGNLEFVHRLVARGVPASVVRLALLSHHYRSDWSWSEDEVAAAAARAERYRSAVSREGGVEAGSTLDAVRAALAEDLDAPAALAAIDAWCARQEAAEEPLEAGAPGLVSRTLDALLGVRL
ncbi:cysteine--1-D-myo-inosityl 2-amino-2-deoxy-alpha-D-glucopyranoside ligase [Aquipuribacter hungaricus]|uniref:L-cysteine:1D-myo-inositol 2-amino-2-deoxy-alpha-D-glucopyranoside ligase n=1 Tax=Aquipuribacter hungaricus TaxID=545624 RepID=A0ABV7WFC1_9MICO